MKYMSKLIIAFFFLLGGRVMAQQAGGSLPKFANDKEKAEWIKAHPAQYKNAGGQIHESDLTPKQTAAEIKAARRLQEAEKAKAIEAMILAKQNANPGFEYVTQSVLNNVDPQKRAYILANPKQFVIVPDEFINQ